MRNSIVVFLGGYIPAMKYGGPVSSIENFVNYIGDDYDIYIISGDHDFKEKRRLPNIKSGWNSVGKAHVIYIPDKNFKTSIFEDILEGKYQSICMFYLSSVYFYKMNFAAIRLARKYDIPVILAPRGDLMRNTISMNSYQKMLKKKIFLWACKITNIYKNVYFQSTSDEETLGLHKYLGIADNRIFQIPNMPAMKRERHNYYKRKGELRVIFISRLMVKKNPLFALEVIRNIDKKYNVLFDIYGPIEDENYWNECLKLIDKINSSNDNIHINYKGSLNTVEAKRIFDRYDCFLFPTISENYGHVIAESLLSECPVIISKGTTPFDDCHLRGGYAAELTSPKEFTKYLEFIAKMDNREYQDLASQLQSYVENKFQVDNLKIKYLQMINKISRYDNYSQAKE